jgi:two-component system KDP operon response regulator KdpE
METRVTGGLGDHANILVVDDDHRMRRLLAVTLEQAGFRVSAVADGVAALEHVAAKPPDLVLLDVMMPRMDGFTCLRHLRATSTVPVVVLTAKGEEHDKVHGLDLGADDFFTKPFDPAELLARVRAVLHCRQEPIGATPAAITIGDLTIDLARQVVRREREIQLTPTECRLLHELVSGRGRVLSYRDLLARIWGDDYGDQLDYLSSFIRYLRAKTEPDPARPHYLLDMPGVGYALATE